MAHLTLRSSYQQLAERLNRFPQGAPPTERLYRILAMLFSEREDEVALYGVSDRPRRGLEHSAVSDCNRKRSTNTRLRQGAVFLSSLLDS